MRFLLTTSTLFLMTFSAQAKVPYSELDTLRKKTVVVRWALDNPDFAWVKACVPSPDKRMVASGNLALATDNAAASWKKQTLTAADLKEISKKLETCEIRGSCSVYEVYLGAVQIPAALADGTVKVRTQLEKKLESLTTRSYAKAFADIPQPCGILKSLTRGK